MHTAALYVVIALLVFVALTYYVAYRRELAHNARLTAQVSDLESRLHAAEDTVALIYYRTLAHGN